MKKVWTRILAHYDKVIAALALMGLVGSLVYLAVRVGMIQGEQRRFDQTIGAMKPLHEQVAPVDTAVYEASLAAIKDPIQLSDEAGATNHMFVPETRVMCIDCRRPIPYAATICPFCNTTQPIDKEEREDFDGDAGVGDGMWDAWERANKLDPRDPKDAEQDADGDGFSNLAEFMADPRTDPRDPASFPPPEAELRLVKILSDPFRLRFKGTSTMPDGSIKFQVNLRGNIRTYFARLGEEVEGFKLEKYEPKTEDVNEGGIARKKDVSVLTLKRGDKLIRLVLGQDVSHTEYVASFFFALDGSKFTKKVGEKLDLKGKEYEVISIDISRRKAIIRRTSDGKEIEVKEFPAGSTPDGRATMRTQGPNSGSRQTAERQGEQGQ